MSQTNNFPIETDGFKFTATATSQAFDLTDGGAADRFRVVGSDDVLIYNPGPNTIYVKAGDASTVANGIASSTPSMAVPPSQQAFSKGNASHLAVISPQGAQEFVVYVGEGE